MDLTRHFRTALKFIRSREVNQVLAAHFHQSTPLAIDQKYRREQRLEANPNRYGSLIHKSDFTYLDGRPSPLPINQFKRLKKQREYAQKIIQAIGEIDFAVERHDKMIEHERKRKEEIIGEKFKSKTHLIVE